MLSLSGSGEANAAGDSNKLWQLVHDECVPHQQAGQNPPEPCAQVNIAGGVDHGDAVLKSKDDAREFLLIPTAEITGIEAPAILAPGVTNYFASAWTARSFVENHRKETIPRDAMSLEINPATHRSQNQLHIHIDCVTEQVYKTLTDHKSEIGTSWAPFPKQLASHNFDAMAVGGDKLTVDPFKLLWDSIPASKDKHEVMADSTLAVVGKTDSSGNPDGFILLKGQGFVGEDIQNHNRCPA
ncbi:CDP-diacylglycerol diphosphatase [Rhodococcus erythropolis]|uniref:CDP-diacylglycerol diphosphatase n=1 Tax=Rhodococcus erythropolis TaxID=1833 RepID=UPI002948E5A0|nr:CDP-diacylglycerol diphosphatase [Rhodococcus erythropolis]MDV6277508.1 CDP-diacylglycerol diphosphatase [Rhodococcus erythropolis]